MLKLHDDLNNAMEPFHLALLYDELFTRSWSLKAEKGDPELNIEKESEKLVKPILAQARTRLASTLKDAGISTGGAGGSTQVGPADSLTMSVMQQQQAAAEQAARRNDEARRRLESEQRCVNQRNNALTAAATNNNRGGGGEGGGHGGGQGGGQVGGPKFEQLAGESNRQARKRSFGEMIGRERAVREARRDACGAPKPPPPPRG